MILSKEKILKISAWVCFISLIFQLVGGLWPQISMFLFGGKVLFPNIVFKIFIMISVLIGFIANRKIVDKEILLPLLLFLGYLTLNFFYLYFYRRYDIKFIIFGFNIYYFYIFLMPLIPSLLGYIEEKHIINSFIFLFFICSILSLCQWYFNSPILPTKSLDGYYEAQVWNFYNYVRAYSFFPTSYVAAVFYSLIGLLSIGWLLKTENLKFKLFFSLLFLIVIFEIYITYSRTGYLVFIFSLLTFVLLNFRTTNVYKIVSKLPIIYFLIGLFIIVFFSLLSINKFKEMMFYEIEMSRISDLLSKGDFTKIMIKNYNINSHMDYYQLLPGKLNKISNKPKIIANDSFVMRLIEWKEFGKLYLSDIKGIFLGYGYYYTKHFNNKGINNFVTDNLYLDILIHIGLIGLFLLFYLIYRVWVYLLKFYNNSLLGKVIISFFSTLTVANWTSNSVFIYFMFLIFLFLTKRQNYNFKKVF